MPGFDGTGPSGEGPMTGRGLGYCRGFFRRGRGFGRGFRMRARMIPVVQEPQMTEAEEKSYLKQELELLKQETQEIEKRLKELKA